MWHSPEIIVRLQTSGSDKNKKRCHVACFDIRLPIEVNLPEQVASALTSIN